MLLVSVLEVVSPSKTFVLKRRVPLTAGAYDGAESLCVGVSEGLVGVSS